MRFRPSLSSVPQDREKRRTTQTAARMPQCQGVTRLVVRQSPAPGQHTDIRESHAKRVRFSHVCVFSDSRNVQKSVTQIIYFGPLPMLHHRSRRPGRRQRPFPAFAPRALQQGRQAVRKYELCVMIDRGPGEQIDSPTSDLLAPLCESRQGSKE